MKYTTHFNLKKPDYTDPADIQDVNDNMDVIDAELTSHLNDYVNPHKVPGKNLLHNWDFRNPVNQRGVTDFASPSGAKYTIDRWLLRATGQRITVNPSTKDITLYKHTNPDSCHLTQMIEFNLPEDTMLTVSVNVKSATGTCGIRFCDTSWGNATTKFFGAGTTGLISASGIFPANTAMMVIITTTDTLTVDKVKLELGSVSTLANDPPADYGEQLALCQRYCLGLGYDFGTRAWYKTVNTFHFDIPLPVTMRIIPSLEKGTYEMRDFSNNTIVDGFTFSYFGSPRSATLTIIATKANHGLTDAKLFLRDNPVFSADL